MYLNCAFTGHRFCGEQIDIEMLRRIIKNLIKGGTKNFYCGMAMGFDLICAEAVLELKKDFPDVKLIACIPYAGQSDKFNLKSLKRYNNILEKCDEKTVLSREFYSGCMHARNRFMVDNCDVLVCFLRKNSGGTYYTVNYARTAGKNIIEI